MDAPVGYDDESMLSAQPPATPWDAALMSQEDGDQVFREMFYHDDNDVVSQGATHDGPGFMESVEMNNLLDIANRAIEEQSSSTATFTISNQLPATVSSLDNFVVPALPAPSKTNSFSRCVMLLFK